MQNNIYRELQERLNAYSLGFPATESGIELKILKKLFSEEDAALFLAMSPGLEKPEDIAQRVKKPVEEIASRLEDMAQRGLVFRLNKGGEKKYAATAYVHGIFEFQVGDMDKEFAEMMDEYFQEKFNDAIVEGASNFLRTVPIQQSVSVTHKVAAYEDACELLRKASQIVVAECICRKAQNLLDKGCKKELEACFLFGSMGQFYLDNGMGRLVEREEAVQILLKAQEQGLVTQPAAAQNPQGMCNCCSDCCGVLHAVNMHPKPAEIVFSNHFAEVEAEECTGCENCLDRCHMGAITITDDLIAEINRDRCIGCGLCVATCPTDAMKLVAKSEEERKVPPMNGAEQMKQMARKRGLL